MKVIKKEDYSKAFEDNIIDWTTFYRRNIHRFIEHYFGIKLHFFQKIMVYLMNLYPLVILICSRAVSKSFTTSVFGCAICVLYPNSKVLVTAKTKKQAGLLISEKIEKELMNMSPNLKREIKKISTSNNAIEVIFHNGSSFIAGVSGEQSRGLRSTILITDEYRLVEKSILDSVLIPTEIQRPTPYTMKKEYQHLVEEPREIYLSSAYFKSHWIWEHIKSGVKDMYKNEAIVFATDLATTLKHGIKTKRQLIRARNQSDSFTFDMEYNNLMIGGGENQYYSFDLVSSAQKIQKAWYPKTLEDYVSNKKNRFGDIKKQDGEIRVVCMDIAVSETTTKVKNDFSCIKCIRALPSRNKYERQEVYIECFTGWTIEKQAIRVRQIMEDFKADYFAFDGRTYGTMMVDEMAKVLYDEERDIEYPPIRVFNEGTLKDRCKNKNAIPIMWAFTASSRSNNLLHTSMKGNLIDGKYKMLISSHTCVDTYLINKSEYQKANSEQRVLYESPYTYSDVTLTEMINLSQTFVGGSEIKLEEPPSGTKDRYITSAIGNLFIQEELDLKLQDNNKEEEDLMDYCFF